MRRVKKDRFINFNCGFTLIEILIVVGILSIILAATSQILVIGERVWRNDMGLVDLQQSTRFASDWLIKELRASRGATIETIDEDSDCITFSTPNEVDIQYYRDANDENNDGKTDQIIREDSGGEMRILAINISRFKASLGGSILEITLEAKKTVLGRELSFSLDIKLKQRND